MMRIVDLRDALLSKSDIASRLPRISSDIDQALVVARELIDDVIERGEQALRDQTRSFDGVEDHELRVPQLEMDSALGNLDSDLRNAIEESIRRVRLASAAGIPPERVVTLARGATVTQRWLPVERVGLYVPGGKAVYPSSVVMNTVAAQVAGVSSIAIASPPQRDHNGRVHPTILATAGLLGVTEVYAMGGAGAIGAFAYGIPSLNLDPVRVITGPGNVFVAAAKRLVRGAVGIDSEAGPTEILIIADDMADPHLIAADLVSQAEHDELASAVLVTASESLAARVASALEAVVEHTTHRDRVVAALNGPQSAIVLVPDNEVAVTVSNLYAPEHLEVHTQDPHILLPNLINAGAIFVGSATPVSLGDYLAGSNHVLPTAGQAAFSSGLGSYTFLRAQQVVEYDVDALSDVRGHIRVFADDENLPAHADAVDARFPDSSTSRPTRIES
jgi:histidinol dehydrogenase